MDMAPRMLKSMAQDFRQGKALYEESEQPQEISYSALYQEAQALAMKKPL